jgi:hypothetical protein
MSQYFQLGDTFSWARAFYGIRRTVSACCLPAPLTRWCLSPDDRAGSPGAAAADEWEIHVSTFERFVCAVAGREVGRDARDVSVSNLGAPPLMVNSPCLHRNGRFNGATSRGAVVAGA